MSRSSPSTFAAIRILRTKGEAGELRSVNMEGVAIDDRRSRGGGLQCERSADGLARQPVMTRLTAFGPLPFLSGSTSKEMRCPSVSDLSPARSTGVACTKPSRPLSPGLMKPEPRSALKNLAFPAMAIGKLPFPVVAPPPTPMARRLGRTFTNGESSGLTASVTPPGPHRRRNVKASAHKNRLIQGCGKVAKLLFAGEPIDAVGALARPR